MQTVDSFYQAFHVVKYYRYLRLLTDGTALSIMSCMDPHDVRAGDCVMTMILHACTRSDILQTHCLQVVSQLRKGGTHPELLSGTFEICMCALSLSIDIFRLSVSPAHVSHCKM